MNHLEPLPILIKLYAKRRLYDGAEGRYRSVDELRARKARRVRFLIVDSSTGDDATDRILSQTRH
jgi:polyhydroxyalkanoate synthesis regulator protein